MDNLFLNTESETALAMEKLQVWLNHEMIEWGLMQFHWQNIVYKVDKKSCAMHGNKPLEDLQDQIELSKKITIGKRWRK